MTAPVVRVTEVVGTLRIDGDGTATIERGSYMTGDYACHSLEEALPEGVEGKRGRFVVTVSFEESE